MRYWLVMPAAGTGQRYGAPLPKQYATIAGRTVIEWSLAAFVTDPLCAGIVVAIGAADTQFAQLQLSYGGRLRSCIGGAHRCDSVLAGLNALPASPQDWVLVHDAARPCVAAADVQRLLAAVNGAAGPNGPAGGLLAVPLADTLKRDDGAAVVAATVARQGLWRALTPQMFRHGELREALQQATARGLQPTDEAQALEMTGRRALLVAGSPRNIKITTPADLALAELLLQARSGA